MQVQSKGELTPTPADIKHPQCSHNAWARTKQVPQYDEE